MKKSIIISFTGMVLLGTSCKKYLDVNNNPNQATTATPESVMAAALVATASNLNGFNSYGSQLVGYSANAGGYGGFGSAVTYNFAATDQTARWSSTYDNLEDYQAILNQTDTVTAYKYYNAMARIMRAHSFALLVDTYNDVPYKEALKGLGNLTPAYTDAKEIYKDLADELDKAIKDINDGPTTLGIKAIGASDVLFKGNTTSWKKFANTLKLRILIRGNGKVTFSNQTFDAAGFLETDALINPGYVRDNNKQNPKWNNWAYSYTGSDATKSWIPNTFVFAFYNGSKLTDPARGKAIYYQFPTTGTNRLGYENTSVPSCPSGGFWYPSTSRTGKTAGNTTGVLKGPEAGLPVITAAESYFLQAEGVLKGILTSGDVKDLFVKGIKASFNYLYQLPNGLIATGLDPVADATAYINDNSGSFLVNIDNAGSDAQKLEAIITQKYIALNYVNGEEAWNEYRRTHYPSIVNTQGASDIETFASLQSNSTRPDHLPTRLLYPSSEGAYNPANVPKNISPFTSLIFWALQ